MGIDYSKRPGIDGPPPPPPGPAWGPPPGARRGAVPTLLPTSVPEGAAPGVRYRIEGELLPVLHVQMDGSLPIFFEHHVILWKQPQIDVRLKKLKGAFKRVLSGMPIFLTEAYGQGDIAFSRDNPGHVFPIHIVPGGSLLVREHQFLAATTNLEYTYERVGGVSSMLFGAQGFFVDRFTAPAGEAVVWLHAHGNAFEVNLAPGEVIDVEPGGWIYREDSVGYSQQLFGLKTGILGGGGNLVFNRFTGPGRVGLQSGYYSGEAAVAGAAGGAGVGGLLGGAGGAARGGAVGGLLGGILGAGGN
jgi:uncharacterized protein (AIM24 family)